MNYFQYQEIVPYQFVDATGAASFLSIVNITQRAQLTARLRQYTTTMYDYVVRDGERPDSVAEAVYGDPKYTWVVLLVNRIYSLYDWPLSYEEFEAYIVAKYGSVQAANEGALFYYTTDAIRVDAVTYEALPVAQRGDTRTPWEQETAENDHKRNIKIVAAQFLPAIDQAIKTLFRT